MLEAFWDPPREFSLLPFWFWNDRLDEAQLLRQMDDFVAHGVYGFVIHPRLGLPRDTGWMSPRMLSFMRFAVEAAARRDMKVVLYDEGMYPSGSSAGQVVETDPEFHCRCLACVPLEPHEDPGHALRPLPFSSASQHLVAVVRRANGQRLAIVERPVDATIRGLHYIDEDRGIEDAPPAADLLNPAAVTTFIRLVYDRYAEVLGDHFGKTIMAIFTDEPGLLGRPRERDVWPGTTDILTQVNRILGYDFTPHLPALWYDDEPGAQRFRADYMRAIHRRLEETYYRQLHDWCEAHGVALTGHPARGDEIGVLRYFHIPGQDLVWRWVLPGATALEGPESTQAKATSSAACHLGRRRNANECCGAYGHELTWDEMRWLADWCFVRGVNLLYPHAFYYSVRGPRRDERPPDVGPHSPWWDRYPVFADYCRRLSWLNTDSRHVCSIAIGCGPTGLPWEAARVCFQTQHDFNYLEFRHLWEDATVTTEGIRLGGLHYRALILDGVSAVPERARSALMVLAAAGRVVAWQQPPDLEGTVIVHSEDELRDVLDHLAPPDLVVSPPQPDLRYRHVVKNGVHYYLLVNEGATTIRGEIRVSASGSRYLLDPMTGETASRGHGPVPLALDPYASAVLACLPPHLPAGETPSDAPHAAGKGP